MSVIAERLDEIIARAQAYKTADLINLEDQSIASVVATYDAIPSPTLRAAFALRIMRRLRDAEIERSPLR